MLAHQGQQTTIERGERHVREVLARLGEGLRADRARQIGQIRQMREEGIELVPRAGLEPDSRATISTGQVGTRWRRKALGLRRD